MIRRISSGLGNGKPQASQQASTPATIEDALSKSVPSKSNAANRGKEFAKFNETFDYIVKLIEIFNFSIQLSTKR